MRSKKEPFRSLRVAPHSSRKRLYQYKMCSEGVSYQDQSLVRCNSDSMRYAIWRGVRLARAATSIFDLPGGMRIGNSVRVQFGKGALPEFLN
jgi:hypothetical protein